MLLSLEERIDTVKNIPIKANIVRVLTCTMASWRGGGKIHHCHTKVNPAGIKEQ